MSLNNGFYESVINKLIDDQIRTIQSKNQVYIHTYIGSSNLSNSALTTGLEWNLKISEYTSKEMINKFSDIFESYWHDNEFYLFDKDNKNDKKKLKIALSQNNNNNISNDTQFYFAIIPYSYQTEILDKLQAEREVHNRYKNLIVRY